MKDTKGNIKLAALKLFNDKGVCSITTNHISEEMGISPEIFTTTIKTKNL